ncbi:hypothetical protein FOG48_00200 [Hanseniaspora uvarum]|uniref:Box C/D snoRNA protein 1 n=1 Tax=Hanseniaspora uvarum TaxID=29833 RepID=A0A1E5RY10_HANUV|nr:hypothetical protein FOG48_00200 [Hanseniaspora uvarum]OEJ91726.1 Box C/D snoRNA protein 1 [Hanseniaspora uvarum]
MNEEAIPLVSQAPKCEICEENTFKYKCSKCLLKYCSIPCLNQHKLKDNCSNRLYDPMEYISNKEMKTFDIKNEVDDNKKQEVQTNHIVKRDYEYLLSMDRQLQVAKTDFKQKNKETLSVGNLNVYNNRTVNKFLTDNGMELKFIMQRGCRCFLMPVGSSKNKRNKSRYDNKQKKFYWTIEWNLSKNIDPDHEKTTIIVDRCYEDMKIMDLIRYKWPKQEFKNAFNLEHIEDKENVNWLNSELKEKVLKQFLDHDKIHIFIKKFPNKMNNILDTRDAIKVQNVDSTVLSELLASKTCVEFPSLFVQIDDYKYVEEDTEEPVDKSIIDTNGKSIQFGNMVLKVYETAEDIENRDNQVIMEKQRLEEEMIQKQKEEEEQIKAKKLEEQNQLKQKRTFSLQEYKGIKKQKLTVSKAQNIPDFHENESEDSDDVTSEEEDEPKQNPSASNSLAARLFG